MMSQARCYRWLVLYVVGALVSVGGARADEIKLRGGKTLRGHVFKGPRESRVNTFGCSLEEMTLGVRRMLTRDIEEISTVPPADELHEGLAELGVADVDRRIDLLRVAQVKRLRPMVARLAAEVLRIKPDHAEALKAIGGARKWRTMRAKRLELRPESIRAVRRIVRESIVENRKLQVAAMTKSGDQDVDGVFIERVAESLLRPRGRTNGIVTTFRANEFAGKTYNLFVPESIDVMSPRPLIVALHGGGIGLQDPKQPPQGSGEEMMVLLAGVAKAQGWYLVAPNAMEAPWNTAGNDAWVTNVVEEVCARWNVDLERVHLIGVGGGANGAWYMGGRHADDYASIGIAAGGTPRSPTNITSKGTALWLYHGESDGVFPLAPVRKVAERIAKSSADFVYCELPKEQHGLPPLALRDWIAYVDPKRRARAKSAWPRSSFRQPAGKAEIQAMGPPDGAWGAHLPKDSDVEGLFDRLVRGTTEAEPAAAKLRGGEAKAMFGKRAIALVANEKAPVNARKWAAWLCGQWSDADAFEALAGMVRSSKDPRLVRTAAGALAQLKNPEAARDLTWALGDISTRYRSVKGQRVPFHEFREACNSGAAVVAAIGTLGKDKDILATIEEQIVIAILRDRRPVAFNRELSENPSEARQTLVKAIVGAYRALGAEKTLFDMLRVAVKADPKSVAIVPRRR